MNKKILFIVNSGKISPNENGGASVYYSHLELLAKCGYTINLLVISWQENNFKKEDYNEVKSFVSSVEHYQLIAKKQSKLERLQYLIFNPAKFEYAFINKENNTFLQEKITKLKSNCIWCEWRWSAIWATNANITTPIIYAHHDWEYKLAKLRGKLTLNKRFHNFQKKRVEFNIVKKAVACISGSNTEAKEIVTITQKKALYLPTTYASITSQLTANKTPNIVHLGGMSTTANRVGLERFLDECWQKISNKHPNVKLKVIGSLKGASASLQKKLKHNNIETLGFVKELQSVLHPQDIHIIPWEYNTGTRTRVPVVFNYEQVLVAIKASVVAFPEIKHKENAILCENLSEMTIKLMSLLNNKDKIKKMSSNGKQIFLNTFTVESQQKKLKTFLDSKI